MELLVIIASVFTFFMAGYMFHKKQMEIEKEE